MTRCADGWLPDAALHAHSRPDPEMSSTCMFRGFDEVPDSWLNQGAFSAMGMGAMQHWNPIHMASGLLCLAWLLCGSTQSRKDCHIMWPVDSGMCMCTMCMMKYSPCVLQLNSTCVRIYNQGQSALVNAHQHTLQCRTVHIHVHVCRCRRQLSPAALTGT